MVEVGDHKPKVVVSDGGGAEGPELRVNILLQL